MSESEMQTDHDYVMVPDLQGAEKAKAEGNELYKAAKYFEAIEKYSEAIKLNPSSHIYLGNRSAVYLTQQKYNNALEDSIAACKLDPKYGKGYSRQLKCNIAMGNIKASELVLQFAQKYLENCEKVFSQELQTLKQLKLSIEVAEKSSNEENFRQAAFYYQKAVDIAVAADHLLVLKAENMALYGQLTEAQAIVLRILQKNRKDALALYVRGLCFYLEDITEKAILHFTEALRMAPDLEKAKTKRAVCKRLVEVKTRGNTAFKAQNFDEACNIYTEALQVDPLNKITNAKLYFNRALARSKIKAADCDEEEKRDRLVIQDCDKAIELDESYVKAYRRRGYAKQNIGEHEEAVRDFETVLKKEPTQENKQAVRDAKKKEKMAARKDYYKILNIAKDADDNQIKKAYKKKALVHHPDRHAAASDEEKAKNEKAFKDVNEAFSILSDSQKRHRYDNGLDVETGGMSGGMGDIDPTVIFQQFFGGGGMGGMGGMGGSPFGGMGGPGGSSGFTFRFG